jgi:hypothetical protein
MTEPQPTFTAVWMRYHEEQSEDFDTFDEALGMLWGIADNGGGAPKRIIRPDGTTVEGDELTDLILNWHNGPSAEAKPTVREVLQRLTLECAHHRLEGPWQPTDEDGRTRHMIGDISWCDLCPKATEHPGPGQTRQVFALRQIVNVENLPTTLYREPDEKANHALHEQRYG